MKTTPTHPRKRRLAAAALTLAALLGALGLSSCAEDPRDTYACDTEVTIGYAKPVKLSNFAQDTDPQGNWREWKQLLIERNHLYTDTLKPGQKVKLPQACKKV